MKCATLAGVLPDGRKVWRVPVRVTVPDTVRVLGADLLQAESSVLALSSTDAANWTADSWRHVPNANIAAFGPRGGRVVRFVGWESAIWRQLSTLDRRQLRLDFSPSAATNGGARA